VGVLSRLPGLRRHRFDAHRRGKKREDAGQCDVCEPKACTKRTDNYAHDQKYFCQHNIHIGISGRILQGRPLEIGKLQTEGQNSWGISLEFRAGRKSSV
jgi:hypothetical protein